MVVDFFSTRTGRRRAAVLAVIETAEADMSIEIEK